MIRCPVLSFALAAAVLAAPAFADEVVRPFSDREKAEIEALVRDYILQNPGIIVESLAIMQAREQAEKDEALQRTLIAHRPALEADPSDPLLGNPEGDVTIVEFFDYQCGYCKSVLGPLMDLVEEDGRIRLVLKEFPILGPESELAATASLAANRQGLYEEFHVALLGLRGRLSADAIWQVAREVGLDVARLQADMADPAIQAQIQKSYRLAEALNIRGTPAFAIGNQIVPGAIGRAQLAEYVARARAESD